MNVSIDTSILRRDRKLESSDILLLGKMSKLGLLKLHVPWIIYREATTQNHIEIKTTVDRIIKELNSFDKKGINESEHLKFKKIAKQIQEIDIETSTIKHWNNFIRDTKSILHKIDEKHGELVMSSYFLGQAPFPEPKSRKDIPDAFIYQALQTISDKFGKILFISDDENLRTSCDKLSNVIGLKTFSDLFDLPDFKSINDQYKKIEHYADELIILEDSIDKLKEVADEDVFNELFNDTIISSPNIPDDNNEGRLINIEEVSNIEIDKTKIQYIENYFYIPVKAEGVFTIDYFIYKSDYYIIDDRRNIHIIDNDWNDHYYLVQEDFEVKFSFKYKIAKDNVENLDKLIVEDINFDEVNIIWEK